MSKIRVREEGGAGREEEDILKTDERGDKSENPFSDQKKVWAGCWGGGQDVWVSLERGATHQKMMLAYQGLWKKRINPELGGGSTAYLIWTV